jgi:hypothetical protein
MVPPYPWVPVRGSRKGTGMRSKLVVTFTAAALAALCSTASAAPLQHLQPGSRTADLREQVPVNVVFVGIEPGQVRSGAFRAGLPAQYRPVVRSRLPYQIVEELGIRYGYDYSVTYADRAWENAFFSALSDLADPAPRTEFQEAYNAQAGTRDVGQNHFIDAPTVEKWLIDHAPSGVDTRRNTIFFVNWWGRRDFIDHVYTKFGEPDPDTGYDFGVNRESRKIIAWGGTTPDDEETGLGRRGERRAWFFDLSAGPESWGGSFDVTNPDLDGDDEPDYRIPAAWEYAPGGYRSPALLAGDLSKVARYAAINLMFTSSPLYPPYLTPELLPSAIELDLNTYEGWPGVDASAQYQKPGYLRAELGELFPARLSTDAEDLPFRGRARHCYELWLEDVSCFPNRPQYPPFANLFLYNALNLEDALDQRFQKGERSRLYEAPGFNYATTSELSAPFLGYADDNYVDGTQSFVFSFISPDIVESGYGLTTTQIHEYGHHFGMSHPHDGFDWESGIDYEPTGPFFFAWATDEHNSMMSYIDLNWDFSQFDRDNAARHQAAGFILNANMIAGRILESRGADRAAGELAAADAAVGRAKAAIAAHLYPGTWASARAAYELVLRGADRAGVKVKPSYNGWAVQAKVKPEERSAPDPVLSYGAFDRIGPGTKRSLK